MSERLTGIMACIDGSAYADAVCDYAGWFAGKMDQPVALLHVTDPAEPEPRETAGRLLAAARQRLADHGVEPAGSLVRIGSFVEVALGQAQSRNLLVLGKRGTAGDGGLEALGGHVFDVLAGAKQPVCLASRLFLPISRALVLLDADPDHQRTVEFVRAHPWLARLELDLVVMSDGRPGDAKLNWARQALSAHDADIYPMPVDGPHEALARYRRSHAVDLLILSREIALSGPAAASKELAHGSFWAWRAPILIC